VNHCCEVFWNEAKFLSALQRLERTEQSKARVTTSDRSAETVGRGNVSLVLV